ncbi:p23 and HSP20-like chaperones fold [Cryptosporidium canis]|uniref:P23 and HSP20-like chaperones fold n=1 Tax=Cryptosporidium canis TaxID=195482 RepID=A0A9D5HYP3_9CRYT|nr:p23 and HSP20-like chaperones fold [Cryptosporidium canis]
MLFPTVLWAQTKKALFVTVDIPDLNDYKVELEEQFLKFHANVEGNEYGFELEFLKPINKEESRYQVTRSLHFMITKKEEERWSYIVKDSSKTKNWLKCDWNRWVDTDEEENPSNKFDMFGGMDGMMGGMGGFDFSQLGDMSGMGGMNFDDAAEDEDEEESKGEPESRNKCCDHEHGH